MGIFDAIKDALTVDDQERFQAAEKKYEQAQQAVDKARKDAQANDNARSRERVAMAEYELSEARRNMEEMAKKAGVPMPADAAPADADPAGRAQGQVPKPADAPKPAEELKKEEPAPAPAPTPTPEPTPAPEPAAPAPAPELRTYTVKKGDTLSAIGKQFGVKWRDIAALNDIPNPDRIYPGQVFKIPNA